MNIRKKIFVTVMSFFMLNVYAHSQELNVNDASKFKDGNIEVTGNNPFSERLKSIHGALQHAQSLGLGITSIGNEGGLDGYLIQDAAGQQSQTIYLVPNGDYFVVGLLFKADGQNDAQNITGMQIAEMKKRFEAAADQYKAGNVSKNSDSSTVNKENLPKENKTNNSTTENNVSLGSENNKVSTTTPSPTPNPETKPSDNSKKTELNSVLGDNKESANNVQIPLATESLSEAKGNLAEPWSSNMNRDNFLTEANKVPYFEVGSSYAPNVVWMIADPQCPFCHKAWDDSLKQLVFDKKIKLNVILIDALPGSQNLAKQIIMADIPGRLWIGSNAGANLPPIDDKMKSDPKWGQSDILVQKNMEFAQKMGIDKTPYMAYVGADGKFYASLGLPDKFGDFLSALKK